jgi:predicted  nucleic acid-binding Zn-ribbon protein
MTELERMLKDTLIRMEQDFSAKLTSQGKTLEEHQCALTAHSQGLRQLQEENSRVKADLQALTRRLHDLAESYKNLELLLSRLNGILNGR